MMTLRIYWMKPIRPLGKKSLMWQGHIKTEHFQQVVVRAVAQKEVMLIYPLMQQMQHLLKLIPLQVRQRPQQKTQKQRLMDLRDWQRMLISLKGEFIEKIQMAMLKLMQLDWNNTEPKMMLQQRDNQMLME